MDSSLKFYKEFKQDKNNRQEETNIQLSTEIQRKIKISKARPKMMGGNTSQ